MISKNFIRAVEKTALEAKDKSNLLLVFGEIKPALVIDLTINRKIKGKDYPYLSKTDTEEIIKVIKASGLSHQIRDKQIVVSEFETKNPLGEKTKVSTETIEILAANSTKKLRALEKCWWSDDDVMIGRALGYPETAIQAFVGGRAALDIETLPKKVKDGDAILFLSPKLSCDHWQEELAEGRKRATYIKEVSPIIYRQMLKYKK